MHWINTDSRDSVKKSEITVWSKQMIFLKHGLRAKRILQLCVIHRRKWLLHGRTISIQLQVNLQQTVMLFLWSNFDLYRQLIMTFGMWSHLKCDTCCISISVVVVMLFIINQWWYNITWAKRLMCFIRESLWLNWAVKQSRKLDVKTESMIQLALHRRWLVGIPACFSRTPTIKESLSLRRWMLRQFISTTWTSPYYKSTLRSCVPSCRGGGIEAGIN